MKKEYKLFFTNNYIYIISNNKLLKYAINKNDLIVNNYLITDSKKLKILIKNIINKNKLNTGVLLSNITIYLFKKYPTTINILKEIFIELNFKNVTVKTIKIPNKITLTIKNNNNFELITNSNYLTSEKLIVNKNKKTVLLGNRKLSYQIEQNSFTKIYYITEQNFYKKILSK